MKEPGDKGTKEEGTPPKKSQMKEPGDKGTKEEDTGENEWADNTKMKIKN